MKENLTRDVSEDKHFEKYLEFSKILLGKLSEGDIEDFEGTLKGILIEKLGLNEEELLEYLYILEDKNIIDIQKKTRNFFQLTKDGLVRKDTFEEYEMWLRLEKGLSKQELVKTKKDNAPFTVLVKKGLIKFDKEKSLFVRNKENFDLKDEFQECLNLINISGRILENELDEKYKNILKELKEKKFIEMIKEDVRKVKFYHAEEPKKPKFKEIEILIKKESEAFCYTSPKKTLKEMCIESVVKNGLPTKALPKEVQKLIEEFKYTYLSRGLYFAGILSNYQTLLKGQEKIVNIVLDENHFLDNEDNCSDVYYKKEYLDSYDFPSCFLDSLVILYGENEELLNHYKNLFPKFYGEHFDFFYSHALASENPLKSLQYSRKYIEENSEIQKLEKKDKNTITWNFLFQNFNYFRLQGYDKEAVELIETLVKLVPESYPYGMAACAHMYSELRCPEKVIEFWNLAMQSTHPIDGGILMTRHLIESGHLEEAQRYLESSKFKEDTTTKICKYTVSVFQNEETEKLKIKMEKTGGDNVYAHLEDHHFFTKFDKLAPGGVKPFDLLWKTSFSQPPTSNSGYGNSFTGAAYFDDEIAVFSTNIYKTRTGPNIALNSKTGRLAPLKKRFLFESSQIYTVKFSRESYPFYIFNNNLFSLSSHIEVPNLLVLTTLNYVCDLDISLALSLDSSLGPSFSFINSSFHLSKHNKLIISGTIAYEKYEKPTLIKYSYLVCLDLSKINTEIEKNEKAIPNLKESVVDKCFLPCDEIEFSNSGVFCYRDSKERSYAGFFDPKSSCFVLYEDAFIKEMFATKADIIFRVYCIPNQKRPKYQVKGVVIIDAQNDYRVTEVEHDFGESFLSNLSAISFLGNTYSFQTSEEFSVLELKNNSFSTVWNKKYDKVENRLSSYEISYTNEEKTMGFYFVESQENNPGTAYFFKLQDNQVVFDKVINNLPSLLYDCIFLKNSIIGTNVGFDYSCVFQVNIETGNLHKLHTYCAPWNYGFTVNKEKTKFVLTDEHQQVYCFQIEDI